MQVMSYWCGFKLERSRLSFLPSMPRYTALQIKLVFASAEERLGKSAQASYWRMGRTIERHRRSLASL
eukprot:4147465-Amphidinium_carterae.3